MQLLSTSNLFFFALPLLPIAAYLVLATTLPTSHSSHPPATISLEMLALS